MEYRKFYDAVYPRDNPQTPSYGWIQWKGTDVCMDVHCKCGHLAHVDAGFFYFYKCPACGSHYAVGQNIKLIELTDNEASYVGKETNGFYQPEPE